MATVMRVAQLLLMAKNGQVLKGSLVAAKGVKVGTLYLCIGHIVPSTLIFLEKNECSGIVVAIEQGEQTIAVDFEIALWHKRLGHMSEKGMKTRSEMCKYGFL